MTEAIYELAIIGAGPGGISAATRAARQGMSHVLLEATSKIADTIQKYQKGKHVMAEPSILPLRSDVGFEAGSREEILDVWASRIEEVGVNIQYDAAVTGISGQQGSFSITLKNGQQIQAKNVLLSLGVQGNPRKLGVPGEDLPQVQNTLESADAFQNETIMVVGAGDSAIENIMALSRKNRVVVINRKNDFARAKEANISLIVGAIANEQVECFYETTVNRIDTNQEGMDTPIRVYLNTPEGEQSVDCHRIITRLGATPQRAFVESLGVKFLSEEADAIPELNTRYESSVPGMFVIGALGGYPLIKQAMNQGFEVVEHLLGNEVKPADHSILAEKLESLAIDPITGEERDVDDIVSSLQLHVRLFFGLNPLNLRELILESQIVTVKAGTKLVSQGEYASTFYNVLRGEVNLFEQIGEKNAEKRTVLGEGQFFGEDGLISGRPSIATAIAAEPCILLASPRRAVNKLMRTEASVKRNIDRVSIMRTAESFLGTDVPIEIMRIVARKAEIQTFKAGETLFSEGDPADRLYMLRRGSVTLSRRKNGADVVVEYFAAGAFIGLVGLTGNKRRVATARATVLTEVLSIDHESFNQLLAADPELQERVRSHAKKRAAQYARMQAQPQKGEILSFLMSQGIGEATDVLLIDESLCVGCDNCEKACASTHQGVSRLDRRAGPSFASLHIPTSCRHCEHPHCMRDCPPDAIHRMMNGEVYIDETCIGCGNCIVNCPYDVIQLAQLPKKVSLISRLMGGKEEAAKVAVKCDMCKDLGQSACVTACPTGAAIRIHAEQVVEIANSRVSL